MPIYEYECLVCGIHFERFQHFDDPPPKECPKGHRGVRRVFTPPAIVFNGPGFYVTDNRNNNGGNKKPTRAKTPKKKKPLTDLKS